MEDNLTSLSSQVFVKKVATAMAGIPVINVGYRVGNHKKGRVDVSYAYRAGISSAHLLNAGFVKHLHARCV